MKIAKYKCAFDLDVIKCQFNVDVTEITSIDMTKVYDAEVLIWNNCEAFGAKELVLFPKLKTFINWGTESDNLNEDYLIAKGITVKKIDFYSTEAVAEYAVSLMLMYERRHVALLQGERYVGGELRGKRIGVVGLGKIGYRVASILRDGFKCDVRYNATSDKQLASMQFSSMQDLARDSDYLVFTVKAGSYDFDIKQIKMWNPDLVIVNVSRDSVAPLAFVNDLVQTGKIRGYVSDIPATNNSIISTSENIIQSPHKAYLTHEAAIAKLQILASYLAVAHIALQKTQKPRLYIARHGKTIWNEKGIYQGRADSELSTEGKAHAQALASYLSTQEITKLYSSPLGRARQTADIVSEATGVKVIEVPEFAEMSFGAFERLPKAAVEEMFKDFFARRRDNAYAKLYDPYPGGESYFDVYMRVLYRVLDIVSKNERSVIIGHESVNRIISGIATNNPPEAMIDHRQKNNELVVIDPSVGKRTIVKL